MNNLYIEVALPVSLYQTFWYKVEGNYKKEDLIGRRVLVPIKNWSSYGVCISASEEEPQLNDIQLKYIEDIPDKEPVFTQKEINIMKKISDYYVSSLGLVIDFFLPNSLKWEKINDKWQGKAREEIIYIPNVATLHNIPKITEKQKELLEIILEKGEISKSEIKEIGFSESIINALVKKSLIKRLEGLHYKIQSEKILKTEKNIYQGFQINLENKLYSLDYIYPEERLEFYKKLFLYYLSQNKSILVVFPSISEIDAIYKKLKNIFADKLFIYHDALSKALQQKVWFNLKNLSGTITLGTISSLMIPIKNLSLIILENASSDSYKSMRTPRIEAKRVVYEIHKEKNIPVIFSSTIPSLEIFYSKKINLIKPLKEKSKIKAKIEILNISKKEIFDNLKKIITEKNKRYLIIANRKPYSLMLYCERCDEEVLCEDCKVPLRIYKENQKKYLKCDKCNKIYEYITHCPRCDFLLKEIGFGSLKVEEFIKKEFKNYKIDVKTTILDKDFSVDKYDYIINLYPEFLLNISDFRGSEKFLRVLTIPAYKALIKYIIISQEDIKIDNFYKYIKQSFETELQIRKDFSLPPFSKLIYLQFSKNNLKLEDIAGFVKEFESYVLNKYESHVRGKNIFSFILKDFKDKQKLAQIYKEATAKGIKLIIDVDPKRF
ncbi:primosomal protein N' [Venenivibrio stagnispumantis]|uniref:Replication restart DNA helicase PriA n=1 Tax=Venenivibrio stagnispumantis TaxID=407998 RepID=A0AA46AF71_9AQUI|nr:hypothetical protein [Venenivibrio stagnispumantis]MCW4573923.1 hypothetical protein [Venenivibrio stagnispumantis]SMP18832.1 replication restart DNA helicase PriA [Venenivibrio stagnispumantis]